VGTTVFGGMIAATTLNLIFIPLPLLPWCERWFPVAEKAIAAHNINGSNSIPFQ